MVIAIIPVLVLIIGLLMYFASANPKVQETGRIMFFCGLLVVLFLVGNTTVRFG